MKNRKFFQVSRNLHPGVFSFTRRLSKIFPVFVHTRILNLKKCLISQTSTVSALVTAKGYFKCLFWWAK